MCEHTHQWIPFQDWAEGFYSKRDDGQTNDVQWFTGRVLSCASQPCETFLFIPSAPGYSAVECELVPMPVARKAVAA